MNVQLVVASGSKEGQTIPIVGAKFIIGRADDCHLKPRSELVSRYHCAIITEGDYVAVRDLGSKNGVFLNGERVSLENEVKSGDKLTIGPLEFYINISVSPVADKKPKVESIGEAVVRTAEIESEEGTDATEATVVADWLIGHDESIQEAETKTISVSAQKELETIKKAKDEKEAEQKQPPQKKSEDNSSKDAAANLLKNFFKGGR
ncbi:MAG: FHA domain-containing protein [Planctomycetaceae bacterium]|jgi:pSer/pThr/pTyr-binding forkhead associated (FHA) protein|nr:FHA domain-containing protein [Planctomycetaceae bacterium]